MSYGPLEFEAGSLGEHEILPQRDARKATLILDALSSQIVSILSFLLDNR